MQACLDLALPYVHERKQFDQPIGEFQLMQGKPADMYTAMTAAKAYVYAVARACDRVAAPSKDGAGAPRFASDMDPWLALEPITELGGHCYHIHSQAGRLLHNHQTHAIGAG